MDFSGHTAMRLRSLGRRLGIFPPLVRVLRKLSGAKYEERFDKALLAAIEPGDTVWDVGANVGIYTDKFIRLVGHSGQVVAFEPSPQNVATLCARFAGLPNLTVLPVALAEGPGRATFYANGSGDGTTDSLVERSIGAVRHEVEVCRGDAFLGSRPPNVVKIDVEGFEWEVLRGMEEVLTSPGLRAVMIEVHFGILSDRGLESVPAKLPDLLRGAGMTPSWIDASHLAGVRRIDPRPLR